MGTVQRVGVCMVLGAFTSCGQDRPRAGQNNGAPADLTAPVDAGLFDLATARYDMAEAVDLTMEPPEDLAEPPDMAASCRPRVNEVQVAAITDGGGNWEYIEIYNPCNHPIDLMGWKLGYRGAANVSGVNMPDNTTLVTFPKVNINAFGYLLLGGSAYPGLVDGKLSSGVGANGAVGLRDGNNALVDSVGWGTVARASAFVETAAAPAPPRRPPPGASIGRLPNGTDTDDNSKDFQLTAGPTPRTANK